jgi:hypothetical protein
MAKYYNTEHIHPFSYDQVAHAIFQRYPNPFASHVLSEDTVYREVINGTTLYSRRFLTKTNKIPKWGERWLSGFRRSVPLLEESYVDNEQKTITIYTRNVGYSNFMTAIEKVVYSACPSNPNQTVAYKQAWVESNFYGLRSAIKNFGIERFKNNCEKATEGFNHVLERIQTQQNSLREMGHVKLAEFQLKKDHLKLQYNERVESIRELSYEKVESIKEKSSAQWNHAKESAKNAKETAKEAAVETAKKGAEIVKASTTVLAEEKIEE